MNDPIKSSASVNSDTMLPDLFSRYPQTRIVFDRYGLSGCGGRLGPVESIHFFARAHGVDEQLLLQQVIEVIANPITATGANAAATATASSPLADTIYRRYFSAGIILALTAGAIWGAWLLWRIGVAGKFTAISIHDVNAHGHAQIFGWVGLFIMGFAYQAFPRIWHTRLVAPWLAAAAFLMMLTGLVLRTVGMTLSESWDMSVAAAMIGTGLEITAVVIFAGQIFATYQISGKKLEPYVGFIMAALGWFMLQAVASGWHTWNTMNARSHDDLLWYVATYQAPLRDLQIHGMALFMILGVCLRMLPALFDLPEVPHRRAWTALGLLITAVLGETAVFIAYRWTDTYGLAAALLLPWGLLALGVGIVVWPWRLWRPLGGTDRRGKFIRAAYGWLAVSLAMLLLLPAYQLISNTTFSHAYYGATRHATTVGFISLMIMGFAAKVVATLNGVDPRKLSALWGPFVLVNAGCLLRVTTQTLTDLHSGWFAVVGVSGTLEVIGLAWWGVGLECVPKPNVCAHVGPIR